MGGEAVAHRVRMDLLVDLRLLPRLFDRRRQAYRIYRWEGIPCRLRA
jgi:hypothetical protein